MTDNPLGRIPSKEELSWIGALVALGALIAPFAAGPLTGQFGRKWTLMSCSVFFALSFILLGTADCVQVMYISRILQVIYNLINFRILFKIIIDSRDLVLVSP